MKKNFRLSERVASFRFALAGLRTMLAQEHNSRVHLGATIGVVVAGLVAGLHISEWRWLLLAVTLVWLAEAFNTAVERLGDAVTTEPNPQIGAAKDIAAAGVLVASACAALIGASVFGPLLVSWLSK